MPLPCVLISSEGKHVEVNESGELLISDGPYDLVEFNELDAINTAYNYYSPNGQKQFVMTGFMAYGDKQITGSTNATVIIYEASTIDTTTVDKVLFQFEIGQNQSVPFPSLRILVNKGVYVNAKTDDDDVHLTILGHFIKC